MQPFIDLLFNPTFTLPTFMTHPVSDNSDAHLNPRDLPACSTLFCAFAVPIHP